MRGIPRPCGSPYWRDSGRSRVTSGSGVWHFARPCGHRSSSAAGSPRVKYNGGPLWKTGYTWQSVYWGTYFTTPSSSSWVKRVDDAVLNIETDKAYSGGLSMFRTASSTRLTQDELLRVVK